MAKFIYKMQNILAIKYKLEEQAKTDYANARIVLWKEEEKLAKLEARKAAYEDRIRELMISVLDILEIKRCENAVETLKYSIKMQILQVKKAEQNLELARVKMTGAMVERKTQEKLKENAFSEFLIELSRQESKEVDELVSFKYNPAFRQSERI